MRRSATTSSAVLTHTMVAASAPTAMEIPPTADCPYWLMMWMPTPMTAAPSAETTPLTA